MRNPFEVTKAVDYTDDEIRNTFVDYPSGGFDSFAAPNSPMPKFLVGGKGGGRTHLMRFYSYGLQRPRNGPVLRSIRESGYLGIYFRASGLNASRFSGKGITDEVWSTIFSYYMDVWLTENLLEILADIAERDDAWPRPDCEQFLAHALADLVPDGDVGQLIQSPISKARDRLASVRKQIDRQINNAAINRRIEIDVRSNPGDLIFTATRSAREFLPGLSDILFVFLVDEFENFSISQQRYINTLIREKTLPTTFLIGGRRWGVRTRRTLSADEENKQGSEYEWVELESSYREPEGAYSEFCFELALRRLRDAGYEGVKTADDLRRIVPSDRSQTQGLGDRAALEVMREVKPSDRPHLIRLKKSVVRATSSRSIADEIVSAVSEPESPMSEKFAIHRLYQGWGREGSLTVEMAHDAASEMRRFRIGQHDERTLNYVGLWKQDLLAQVYLDAGKRPAYLGVDKFIEASGFLPRSFLMTMKYVTIAAGVRGDSPFDGHGSIGSDAQMSGLLRASRWFLRDSRPSEGLGGECERAIRRLATLFNRMRFSDKPVEVSCVCFSTDFHGLSREARAVVDLCADHSLIIEIPDGRAARNDGSSLHKYQLNPMLSPTYGLSLGRRGEINLKPSEMYAIFDPSASEEDYSATFRPRLRSMRAPFRDQKIDMSQDGLF